MSRIRPPPPLLSLSKTQPHNIFNIKMAYFVYFNILQKFNSSIICLLTTEAQLGGGRPGARPPLAPERGGAPPLQNEKKERMAKISIIGTENQ